MSREKFARQFAQRQPSVADLFDGYCALVIIVMPAAISPTIFRDPADDQVLAAALAAQADLSPSAGAWILPTANSFIAARPAMRTSCREAS